MTNTYPAISGDRYITVGQQPLKSPTAPLEIRKRIVGQAKNISQERVWINPKRNCHLRGATRISISIQSSARFTRAPAEPIFMLVDLSPFSYPFGSSYLLFAGNSTLRLSCIFSGMPLRPWWTPLLVNRSLRAFSLCASWRSNAVGQVINPSNMY